jgi:mycothiol synthase
MGAVRPHYGGLMVVQRAGSDDDPHLSRPGGPQVMPASRLEDGDRAALTSLVAAAGTVDGVAPLSEHALLHLRTEAGPRSRHLVVREPGAGPDLLAVAHVDLGQGTEPAAAELVVRPDRRREGLGSALLQRLESLAGASPLRVWAHGDLSAARGLAQAHGYHAVRELWQMSRPLTDPLPTAPLPDGFTLRAFRPGEDDGAWLKLNAAAFAHHAEQGAWQSADLEQRMAEPWFDPAGFLLLVDEATGALAGFHWTKVHAAPGVGEVYVVGVSPDYQGRGLAKPLTLAGLAHLRDQGLPRVILYVDGDNDAALRTYSGLGFTRSALDVQYARQLLP